MTPAALIRLAANSGVELRLVDGKVRAMGTPTAVAGLLEPLRQHRDDLIRWFTASPANELIAAAMKVCDQHGDNEAARETMRRECLELSPEMQRDLLAHFQGKPALFH